MYVELDINLQGLKVLNVGFLIMEELNRNLGEKHHMKLPGIIGWNMVQLSYQILMEKYGVEILTSLNVWEELIHSCSLSSEYHYADVSENHNLGVQSIYHQTNSDI